MSSPKHLWSGDWQRESPEMAAAPAGPRQAPAPPEPDRHRDSDRHRDPGPDRGPERGRTNRTLIILGAVVVVLAAVGVALGLTLGGTTKRQRTAQRGHAFIPRPFNGSSGGNGIFPTQTLTTPQTTPQTPSQTTTTPQPQTTPAQVVPQQQSQTPIGPTYHWLGMDVSATPSGVAVATVDIGGDGDHAGIDPGDVISTIDHTTIGSIAGLRSATSRLKLGSTFKMTVDRGSTAVLITTTLTDRPSR